MSWESVAVTITKGSNGRNPKDKGITGSQIQWSATALWELVLVCVGVAVKRTMYQRKVDVDMLNTVKSVLADVSSVSPSSEQKRDQSLWELVLVFSLLGIESWNAGIF